jgi:hypothetical protein
LTRTCGCEGSASLRSLRAAIIIIPSSRWTDPRIGDIIFSTCSRRSYDISPVVKTEVKMIEMMSMKITKWGDHDDQSGLSSLMVCLIPFPCARGSFKCLLVWWSINDENKFSRYGIPIT